MRRPVLALAAIGIGILTAPSLRAETTVAALTVLNPPPSN